MRHHNTAIRHPTAYHLKRALKDLAVSLNYHVCWHLLVQVFSDRPFLLKFDGNFASGLVEVGFKDVMNFLSKCLQ